MGQDAIQAIGNKSKRPDGDIGVSFGQPTLLQRTEISKDTIDIIGGANTPNKKVNLTNNVWSAACRS